MTDNIATATLFATTRVPLDMNGARVVVELPAQATACPFLVITPALGVNKAGDGAFFQGSWSLLHGQTGRVVVGSHDPDSLGVLAALLADCGDWDFTDPAHFSSPENVTMVDKARTVIRDWQIGQGYTGRTLAWGDDEEKRAAWEREPAAALLREELDLWPKHFASIYDRKLLSTNEVAWYEAVSCSVSRWGLLYMLAVLQRISPPVADIAARLYQAQCDAGDGMGEWVAQWVQELADGKPLSLNGIPDPDPLAHWVTGSMTEPAQ